MTTGELITRASIWLAMLCWTAAIISRGKPSAKWYWAAGFDIYCLHILFAYGVFYEWSNETAWDQTAQQTAEVTGLETGVGLIVNFTFAAILLFDVIQQWRGRKTFRNLVDAFVIFMIVNGAIVFGHGPVRVYGAALILALVLVARKHLARSRSTTTRGSS
ncbi:MAG: hypothetical protein CMO55_09000 [Verrucomicrobiales bacterium]|nr:hypothetical protein [Verrucomicrobiales bacterium]